MDAAWTTPDGLTLRTRLDTPPGDPLAHVVLVHGIGDHVDGIPYVTAAASLAARGFVVRRMELRGHGRSDGARVYVDAWEDFRRDLRAFIEDSQRRQPRLPLFIVGISLGGLIVIDQALHHPDGLHGVVALAPALGRPGASAIKQALLPLLVRLLPRLPLDAGLDLNGLTRDPEMQRAYVIDDPLYQRKVTPRLGSELLRAIDATGRRAADLRVPLLIQHGDADPVTPPQGSRGFFERAGSPDKTYASYPGALHNLFVETNRDEVVADIAAWIIARVPARPYLGGAADGAGG